VNATALISHNCGSPNKEPAKVDFHTVLIDTASIVIFIVKARLHYVSKQPGLVCGEVERNLKTSFEQFQSRLTSTGSYIAIC
jgi:hypothetical protein